MNSTNQNTKECCDYEKCPAYKYCWDDNDNKFPPIRTFLLIGAFFFYVVDVGLDIWVAVEHYIAIRDGTDAYARYYLPATLFFIIVPTLIINFLSWMLYSWGWLMYKSPKVRSYCDQQCEPLTYVKYNDNGPMTHVPINEIQVISWSWYKSSRERRIRGSQSQPTSPRSPTSPTFHHQIELHEYPSRTTSGHKPTISVEAVFDHDDPKSSDCWEDSGNEERGGIVGLPSPQSHARKGSTVPILDDFDHDSPDGVQFYPLDLFDNYEYVIVTLIHLFQLGYIFRVIRLLYKRKQDGYSFDRYRDLSFLRLMESFLESAPQVVIQLYIALIKEESRLSYRVVTPISIIVSVCSLALAVADYISATKDLDYYDPPPNHDRRPRLSWKAYFVIILWHLCMIAGRTITFALFASIFGGYVFLVVALHYMAMLYWSYWQQAHVFISPSATGSIESSKKKHIYQRRSMKSCLDPRNHLCTNYGIEFIIAGFNIFFHFKIRDGGSSLETLVPFYTLTFVENTIMIFLWYFARDMSVQIWYGIPAIVMVFVTFFIGILLLILYYNFFQPQHRDILEPNPDIQHPTMTCTLNRLYMVKQRRGSVFQRIIKAETFSTVIRRLSN